MMTRKDYINTARILKDYSSAMDAEASTARLLKVNLFDSCWDWVDANGTKFSAEGERNVCRLLSSNEPAEFLLEFTITNLAGWFLKDSEDVQLLAVQFYFFLRPEKVTSTMHNVKYSSC